jgi:hypothetical protein
MLDKICMLLAADGASVAEKRKSHGTGQHSKNLLVDSTTYLFVAEPVY